MCTMCLREAELRRDRVDDRDRALELDVRLDAELLAQLAPQRLDDRLPRVDAAAGQEPVLLAGLLLTAEQHAALPLEDRRDADARFHQCARRAEAAFATLAARQLVHLDELDRRQREHDELGDPHALLDDEGLPRVGVEQRHLHLTAVARVDRGPVC